jgi:hypothetical protein
MSPKIDSPNVSDCLAISVSALPIAVRLIDAAKLVGLPAWTLKESVLLGSLRARKAGRTHIIEVDELRRWVSSLEYASVSTSPKFLARRSRRAA